MSPTGPTKLACQILSMIFLRHCHVFSDMVSRKAEISAFEATDVFLELGLVRGSTVSNDFTIV